MFKLNSRVFPIRSHVALLIMLVTKEPWRTSNRTIVPAIVTKV